MEIQEKILTSALRQFVTKGFSATTAAISKDAGISAGLLFYYFPTKKNLIETLYTNVVLEFHQNAVNIMGRTTDNDLENYKISVKQSRESLINWALNNWQKFQYMELFESSLLAKQFNLSDNQEINGLTQQLIDLTTQGIQHQYLKDLPADFIVQAALTSIKFSISYLYYHPKVQYKSDFLETTWQIHWDIIAR